MRAWLPNPRLDPRTREELLALLDAPVPRGGTLRRDLEDFCRERCVPVPSTVLNLMVQVDLSEEEASRHWEALCAHREEMAARLGRDPGLRVAALDFFSRVDGFLARPVMMDDAAAERSLRGAWLDGLTGLFSPHHFQVLLSREIRRSARRNQEFSLLRIDLDDFGRISGSHGRTAADAVLKSAAGILLARLRDADIAARAGPAGFSLLLPGTRRLGAYVVGERIRVALEERFREPGPLKERLLLTLSAGVGSYPADGETRELLLERTTLALGRARERGGNSVVLHYQEKREGVRFRPVGRSLRIRAFPRGGRPPLLLKAIDLSDTGALMESAASFQVGEELDLRLPDLLPQPDLVVPARVERQWESVAPGGEKRFRAGLRFLADAPRLRKALEAFLSGLRGGGIEQGDA